MENRTTVLDGFAFELTGFFSTDGVTTLTISVSGNGQGSADLKGWICEICPADSQEFADINILSCEKRRRSGTLAPAIAQKTSFELTGDIGIDGVIITDWIGRYEDDPSVEYRLVLDAELCPSPFRVGIMQGETVCISKDALCAGTKHDNRVWALPKEKSFCLFMIVPEGYKPDNVKTAAVSVSKSLLHIVFEDDEDETGKAVRAKICGCVRIVASVPLKSREACGGEVFAAACDCFELCETIGYADSGESFDMHEINVCPVETSCDLTLLNAHYGKAVYRLDGKYALRCKGMPAAFKTY